MATKKKEAQEFLTYKGKPLVKCANEIYYGDINDPFIVKMLIINTTEYRDITKSGKMLVQLLSTDQELRAKDRIIKTSEKTGLYNALNIASIWLTRALNEEQ